MLGERRKLVIKDVGESVFETSGGGGFHGWPSAVTNFGLMNSKGEVVSWHFLSPSHLPRLLRVCGHPVSALKQELLPSLSVINLHPLESPLSERDLH